jgi:hypothetical protein
MLSLSIYGAIEPIDGSTGLILKQYFSPVINLNSINPGFKHIHAIKAVGNNYVSTVSFPEQS